MLPSPARRALDRLTDTLLALIEAVSAFALVHDVPEFPRDAAQVLLLRLGAVITTLVRIDAFGPRAPKPTTSIPSSGTLGSFARIPSFRVPRPALLLPRRPGWLLAALPDVAPAVAADLAALLDDPDLAALLAAAPLLHRPLRPILRALGLTPPPAPTQAPPPSAPTQAPPPSAPPVTPSPPPHPAPPASPPIRPGQARPPAPTPHAKSAHLGRTLPHVQFVPS